MHHITIRGARTHNLKDISLTLPRDRLIVFTGLSGSGKSSLAFDTLYAEGQRRYVESLSAYARQFLSLMDKPDVDSIEGLSPAISIEQKSTSHNPRSTVGTITEIYDYLRLLFARVGDPCCPEHGITLKAQSVSEMVDQILALPLDTKLMLLAPVIRERKGEHLQLLKNFYAQGFLRARINGETYELDQPPQLDLQKKHTIEIIVDRFKVREEIKQRLAESIETALSLSDGLVQIAFMEPSSSDKPPADLLFSSAYACPLCGYSLDELEPRLFSFNSPVGACETCDGLGVTQAFDIHQVLINKALPLSHGALKSWNRNNPYYYHQLTTLAEHYHFSLDTPFEQLPQKIQDVLLYGSGETPIKFKHTHENGSSTLRIRPFEGVIPHLNRRYRESDSGMIKEELAKLMIEQPCPSCQGSRLNLTARNVFIGQKNLPDICSWSIETSWEFFKNLTLQGTKAQIAQKILKEISERLGFLVNVGLEYLSLNRKAETLSGGEAQRIRLASQIGAGLVGVMYVLDEPSIGLHQRDNQRLLDTLIRLRDLGNTVIVVEHDEDAIRQADFVVDIGPGAGKQGGEIVAFGSPQEIANNPNSLTGRYLAGLESIAIPHTRTLPHPQKWLRLIGASGNNLKQVTLEIPLGLLTCITGVSGSGKSTLINETLYPICAKALNKAYTLTAMAHDHIEGLEHLDKVVEIDQSPIGRTPRSNPATYVGLFTVIRELFTNTPESRTRGYKAGRFSFNVKGGRCEACEGDGVIKVEMHFLPDVYVECDQCHGKRYNRETLEVLYKGKNIHEVLEMPIDEALEFFKAVPPIAQKLETLVDVGLGYIQLGQRATTLSGGEAQRVKLAKELSRRDTGQTLYILDEPTTGLHFQDVKKLLEVLVTLKSHGNTLIIIEHNLDVIKVADWIVDLGPEGGYKGGEILITGTPEKVAQCAKSYTGQYLRPLLTTPKSSPRSVEPKLK